MPPFPASSKAVDDGPITPLILLRQSVSLKLLLLLVSLCPSTVAIRVWF
ncbi:hypothetical protein CSHISOI_08467 [Colletotrichum shisoi]|uniref:Uncharacterized protein n=1 Tax=Colletotrichum shisoi TaxID=2078593 RepID=A0A5Q4BJ53_9PEZI|nr:hypothetical protein CSHISOI_08467 [Colletotrichum shisoi]